MIPIAPFGSGSNYRVSPIRTEKQKNLKLGPLAVQLELETLEIVENEFPDKSMVAIGPFGPIGN